MMHKSLVSIAKSLRIYICAAVILAAPIAAQTKQGALSIPTHFPYSFENFPWWTDDTLRALLRKKILGLTDEISTSKASLGKVRDALTTLLKERGIDAQVQSFEPSYSAVQKQPAELFGQPLPPAPPPTVIFSILTPRVLIGKLDVQSSDDLVKQLVQPEIEGYPGRPYALRSQAFLSERISKMLAQHGYLGSKVSVEHSSPQAVGGNFEVDLKVAVEPGPVFHISSITADGGPLLQGRDLSSFITAKPGDRAGWSPFNRLGPAVAAHYRRYGFADVYIKDTSTLDLTHASVDYQMSVDPGPLYHLRTLTIEKLNRKQEERVRELLEMKPGDIFQDDAINDLYRKIADEPLLRGLSFSFAPKRDKAASAIDLNLSFFVNSDEGYVTTRQNVIVPHR